MSREEYRHDFGPLDRELAEWHARQPAKRRRDLWIDVSRILVIPVALLLAYVLFFSERPRARYHDQPVHYYEDRGYYYDDD